VPEIREFLISRRAKITPQRAGSARRGHPTDTWAATRRGRGPRRGEIEYYSKLEGGVFAGVSASVLDAIARALSSTTPNLLNLTLYSAEPGSPTAHALAPDDSTTRWS